MAAFTQDMVRRPSAAEDTPPAKHCRPYLATSDKAKCACARRGCKINTRASAFDAFYPISLNDQLLRPRSLTYNKAGWTTICMLHGDGDITQSKTASLHCVNDVPVQPHFSSRPRHGPTSRLQPLGFLRGAHAEERENAPVRA